MRRIIYAFQGFCGQITQIWTHNSQIKFMTFTIPQLQIYEICVKDTKSSYKWSSSV